MFRGCCQSFWWWKPQLQAQSPWLKDVTAQLGITKRLSITESLDTANFRCGLRE